MNLRLGDVAPDFEADATHGALRFHEWIDGHQCWTLFFSHPADFKLGRAALLHDAFEGRRVKLLGLSCDGIRDHCEWIKDINEVNQCDVRFPVVADGSRKVASLYGMLDQAAHDATNLDGQGLPLTVRSVFVIDPKKRIRLMLVYPASCGRSYAELLRVIDSLQLSDRQRVTTPADWQPGDEVIVHPSVSDAETQRIFGGYRTLKPYLRLARQAVE